MVQDAFDCLVDRRQTVGRVVSQVATVAMHANGTHATHVNNTRRCFQCRATGLYSSLSISVRVRVPLFARRIHAERIDDARSSFEVQRGRDILIRMVGIQNTF